MTRDIRPARRSLPTAGLIATAAVSLMLPACTTSDSSSADEPNPTAVSTSEAVAQADVPTTNAPTTTEPAPPIELGGVCDREGATGGDDLECRRSVGGAIWASRSIDGFGLDPGADDEPCRLPDQRTEPRSADIGQVIGFPLSLARPMTSSIGELKLVAVAVDFPDFLGQDSELSRLRETAVQVDTWLASESQGRATSSWTFHEEWITLSKPAADYGVQGFGTEIYQEVSTEIVDRVLQVIELVEVDQLFVYFPDSLTQSESASGIDPFSGVLAQIGIPKREIEQFAGSRIRNMKGSGTVSQRNGNQLWAIWAHELLHSMGLEAHGPEPTALIDSVSNGVFTLSGWSRWLLGWLDDEQVACIPAESLPSTIDLLPLQIDDNRDGVRLAMIPLGPTQAIAVESHRAVGTGTGLGKQGTYGLLSYVIDSKMRAPYDPFSNDETIGTRFIYPTSVIEGERQDYGAAAQDMSPLQPLMFVGEKAVASGVTISFDRTSGFDTVSFSLTE